MHARLSPFMPITPSVSLVLRKILRAALFVAFHVFTLARSDSSLSAFSNSMSCLDHIQMLG